MACLWPFRRTENTQILLDSIDMLYSVLMMMKSTETQKPNRKYCRTCYDDPCRCRQIQAELVATAMPTRARPALTSDGPCRRCGTYCYGDCHQ